MRVNIISIYNRKNPSTKDVDIMRGILTVIFGKDVDIQLIQYVQPQCREADINVFFDVVNPSLLSYASKNIWIPSHEKTYQTWIPYANMMNEIWAKTHETERIFKQLTSTCVRYIGWTSLNKQTPSKKNYHKALLKIENTPYCESTKVFDTYAKILAENRALFVRLPILHVVSAVAPANIPEEITNKVVLHVDISDSEYDELLTECGLFIRLAKADGFSHSVNEAMASGSNLLVSSISPYLEDIVGEANIGASFCASSETTSNTVFLGSHVETDPESIKQQLVEYVDSDFKDKQTGSGFMRRVYETNHGNWIERIKSVVMQVMHVESPYSLSDGMPKEDELPDVSIICVTRDRRMFMPILKYSYMIQSYPEEKLELVIVDDGDDPIEDTLFGVPNVTYIKLDQKMTIGQKRNIGISKSSYEMIAFMDDDDVYPNNSVLERVAMILKSPAKHCAFCTTIPCYDITKYSSFMNAPPIILGMSERISEATLAFTKGFWNERNFEDIQIAEGNAFIRGREHMCRELSPQEVIVSLVHSKNTSSRKLPEFKEPNGCHFGFNEKLFAMVSEIGESLKTV
jgi:hypothetical protein